MFYHEIVTSDINLNQHKFITLLAWWGEYAMNKIQYALMYLFIVGKQILCPWSAKLDSFFSFVFFWRSVKSRVVVSLLQQYQKAILMPESIWM